MNRKINKGLSNGGGTNSSYFREKNHDSGRKMYLEATAEMW